MKRINLPYPVMIVCLPMHFTLLIKSGKRNIGCCSFCRCLNFFIGSIRSSVTHVLPGRLPEQNGFLWHQANQVARLAEVADDIVTGHANRPRARRNQTTDDRNQGGFTGAIGPNDTDPVTPLDDRGKVLYDPVVTEAVTDMLKLGYYLATSITIPAAAALQPLSDSVHLG